MKAPDGTICTQFDLHDCEDVSLIKYDALSVEAMDKIHICLELLIKNEKIDATNKTLKEIYEETIGVYNLERDNIDMWKMVWNHEILSLFQMEQQSGIKGISLIKPKSVNDLSVLNSVIRLMAPDKNSDTPLEMWDKYRHNINLWKNEMRIYGLTEEEIEWLSNHSAVTDGICESQEGLMSLVQEPRLGGNSLNFADKCRKGVAKKQGKLFEECEEEFFNNLKKSGGSEKLGHYVWDVLVRVQRGYSFNRSHCLAYSLVALQEMNLAFRFPIIYWNCACLISDSGSFEEEQELIQKDKKKNRKTNYGKIAKAIGSMRSKGIEISLVDINSSQLDFEPDEKNNQILYGLGALNGVGNAVIQQIIENRPYAGIIDFINRCPQNKTVMISLIKAGAFDKLDSHWAKKINKEPRIGIMAYYLSQTCGMKKVLNLRNVNGLITENIFPESMSFEKNVFNFNKGLRANYKYKDYYYLENDYLRFYDLYFESEGIEVIDDKLCIVQKEWDKKYKLIMESVKEWLKENQQEVLNEYNKVLFTKEYNKYAANSISAWEMESLCFYYHEHELAEVDNKKYGIVNYFSLPEVPVVEAYWGPRRIPIYKTYKIIGTVIDKNEMHSLVTILTTSGVVTVKFTKDYFAMFNRQISEAQSNGTKKVMEKSWFSRGTKIMITGYRRDDVFQGKTYKRTPTHQLYKILKVENGEMKLSHERYGD